MTAPHTPEPTFETETVHRYADDARVTARGSGYNVTGSDGETYAVRQTNVFGWAICHGPNLDFVPTDDGGFAIGFRNAHDAIDALLLTGDDTDVDGA
jgi:hypothetical protein